MSEKEIIELVEEAKKPGTFNIINLLKERAYPSQEVNIFLTEDLAYEAAKIKEQLDDKTLSDAQAKEFDSKLKELVARMDAEKIVFHIVGISEGLRNNLLEEAIEKYPIKYSEDKNPFTGETKRIEEDDKDRDSFFTILLWREHISKIVSPNGDEQDSLTLEDVKELRANLPLASIAVINEAIEKVRVASAVFMASVDEDFLAKS